jgi:hypothetical protein
VSQAVAALVGALIGGLLTSGSSWGMATIANRRADSRDAGLRERELREAARLIDDELMGAASILSQAILRRAWIPPGEQLSLDRWLTYGPILARSELSDDSWTWLADCYQAIREANVRIVIAERRDERAVDDRDEAYLSGIRGAIEAGLEALRADVPGLAQTQRLRGRRGSEPRQR